MCWWMFEIGCGYGDFGFLAPLGMTVGARNYSKKSLLLLFNEYGGWEAQASQPPFPLSSATRGETTNDHLISLAHYQSSHGRKHPRHALLQRFVRLPNLSPTAGVCYTPGPKAPR